MVQQITGICGVLAGPVLAAYFLWNALVVPPFPSGHAFLEYAATNPFYAFFDDCLLLGWQLLVIGLALGLHRKLGTVSDASLLAVTVGLVGLLLGTVRSAFNIGRLQTLAAAYATADEADRELLVKLLGWTDHGDVARNLALVLLGIWALWTGALVLQTRLLPRYLGWFGIAGGASLVPVAAGYVLGVPSMGLLGGVVLLWVAWTIAAGLHLWASSRVRTVPARG